MFNALEEKSLASIEQYAKALAKAFVDQTNQAKREEVQRGLAEKITVIQPTLVKTQLSSLFLNVDEPIPSEQEIMIRDWPLPDPAIPIANNNYFFRKELLTDVLRFLCYPTSSGLFLTGKKGTGKSSVIEQVCARLGLPLYKETGSANTEYLDLFGSVLPTISSKLKFLPGPLYQAMKQGGIFLLDEVDMMQPNELVKLNEIFSMKRMFVPQTEEFINIHKDFRFVVTGNTNGSGVSGSYIGAKVLNEAFMDRFFVTHVDYMTPAQEIECLKSFIDQYVTKHPNLKRKAEAARTFVEQMVELAGSLRRANEDTETPVLSLRGLERWVTLVLHHKDPKAAFEMAYANSLDDASKEGVMEALDLQLTSFN